MRLNKCFTMPFNRLTCHQIVEGLVLCAKPRRGSTKQVNYIIIMKLTSKKGFSLIELLVALSILAVVAAVIVPRFLNVRTEAAYTATQSQQRTLQRAIQQWLSLGGGATGTPGVITSSNKSGDILLFLNQTAAAAGGARPTGGSTGLADSSGSFGSTTVSISLGTISGTALTNNSSVGYYAVSGADAMYCDGAGSAYTITVSPSPGAVTFAPLANAANFAKGNIQ